MLLKKILMAMLVVLACAGFTQRSALAAPAPDANSVLILDSTVTGGAASLEALAAAAAGHTVEVVSDAVWSGKSAADFASYRALVLGDDTCGGVGTSPWLNAALANRGTWGPVVNGNVIDIGTDPVYHSYLPGAGVLIKNSIKFAADEPTKTGLYADLSCYYHGTAPGTPVPVLDVLGMFTVTGVGCYNDAHIVAVHPALTGLTDADVSGWFCSVHEAFDSFPADFIPLVIARDPAPPAPPFPGSMGFADGSTGVPYILVRGEKVSPVLCGNGVLEPTEECDDGNVLSGDGCSAACKIEIPTGPICGNKTIEPPSEQCDDGNTVSGDGCSSTCKTENKPPLCTTAAASLSVLWPPNHKFHNVGIDGVEDPEGGPVTVVVTSVMQDEPTNGLGDGDTPIDAVIHTNGTVDLRAERTGNPKVPGDGRVYHVSFMATDSMSDTCAGVVTVCVPHDMGRHKVCVDGGPLYDSTK